MFNVALLKRKLNGLLVCAHWLKIDFSMKSTVLWIISGTTNLKNYGRLGEL